MAASDNAPAREQDPATSIPVARLNHAVLYVRDASAAAEFYHRVFGFEVVESAFGGRAVFMRAAGGSNHHDLGLFSVGPDAPRPPRGSVGLYHLAWEVDTLAELSRLADRLAGAGALVGASDHGTTKALYAHDPDGIEFEVSWLVPAELIDDATLAARKQIGPLDLYREIARYGAETRGGVGISVPAGP